MFSRPKQKKTCRYVPIAIESKLKPLPNIGNNALAKTTSVGRNRNPALANRTANSRSNDRSAKSGSVTERDVSQRVRITKLVRVGTKKGREGTKYRNYGRRSDTNIASSEAPSIPTFYTGRSSDPSFEDTSRKHALPDPYADLRSNVDSSAPLDPNAPWWLFLAEMRLQARRQFVNIENRPEAGAAPEVKLDGVEAKKSEVKAEKLSEVTMVTEKPNCKMDGTSGKKESMANGDGEKAVELKNMDDTKGAEETTGDDVNENDDDDDEEEDESGLPQAVRAMQQKSAVISARDVVKERHRAMMEDIARTKSRSGLVSHLQTNGFFNYDYSQHARTSMTNNNLRKGKKKGMERLLMLLSCRLSKCTAELYGAVS